MLLTRRLTCDRVPICGRATGWRQQTWLIEADTPRQARQLLRDQGMWVSELDAISAQPKRRFGTARGLGTQKLAIWTRQFATLLDAGLTIEQALAVLLEQSEDEKKKSVCRRLCVAKSCPALLCRKH